MNVQKKNIMPNRHIIRSSRGEKIWKQLVLVILLQTTHLTFKCEIFGQIAPCFSIFYAPFTVLLFPFDGNKKKAQGATKWWHIFTLFFFFLKGGTSLLGHITKIGHVYKGRN